MVAGADAHTPTPTATATPPAPATPPATATATFITILVSAATATATAAAAVTAAVTALAAVGSPRQALRRSWCLVMACRTVVVPWQPQAFLPGTRGRRAEHHRQHHRRQGVSLGGRTHGRSAWVICSDAVSILHR